LKSWNCLLKSESAVFPSKRLKNLAVAPTLAATPVVIPTQPFTLPEKSRSAMSTVRLVWILSEKVPLASMLTVNAAEVSRLIKISASALPLATFTPKVRVGMRCTVTLPSSLMSGETERVRASNSQHQSTGIQLVFNTRES
jgi:hypothetical protein